MSGAAGGYGRDVIHRILGIFIKTSKTLQRSWTNCSGVDPSSKLTRRRAVVSILRSLALNAKRE